MMSGGMMARADRALGWGGIGSLKAGDTTEPTMMMGKEGGGAREEGVAGGGSLMIGDEDGSE